MPDGSFRNNLIVISRFILPTFSHIISSSSFSSLLSLSILFQPSFKTSFSTNRSARWGCHSSRIWRNFFQILGPFFPRSATILSDTPVVPLFQVTSNWNQPIMFLYRRSLNTRKQISLQSSCELLKTGPLFDIETEVFSDDQSRDAESLRTPSLNISYEIDQITVICGAKTGTRAQQMLLTRRQTSQEVGRTCVTDPVECHPSNFCNGCARWTTSNRKWYFFPWNCSETCHLQIYIFSWWTGSGI